MHDPGPAVPSRPRPAGATKSTSIDHVFVRGAASLATTVLDVQGLSDHNPVLTRIRM